MGRKGNVSSGHNHEGEYQDPWQGEAARSSDEAAVMALE